VGGGRGHYPEKRLSNWGCNKNDNAALRVGEILYVGPRKEILVSGPKHKHQKKKIQWVAQGCRLKAAHRKISLHFISLKMLGKMNRGLTASMVNPPHIIEYNGTEAGTD